MRNTLLFLIMVALGAANAQERPFFSAYKSNTICSDPNGHIYLASDEAVEKFDGEGRKMNAYSNPSLGNITCVDSRIPSKILVFRKESGLITLLGSELTEISPALRLFDKGWMNIGLAAMGGSDRIVLYDEVKRSIIITDLSLTTISATDITFPEGFRATDLQVIPNNYIALTDTAMGVCLLDHFGTFEKYIPLQHLTSARFYKNCFFYLQKGNLYKYSLPTETTPLAIEEIVLGSVPDMRDFIVLGTGLYYIGSDGEAGKLEVSY